MHERLSILEQPVGVSRFRQPSRKESTRVLNIVKSEDNKSLENITLIQKYYNIVYSTIILYTNYLKIQKKKMVKEYDSAISDKSMAYNKKQQLNLQL